MAKFKKPILLQEEFAAGEVSNNPTTPAVKTTSDTVGTEQVAANKSGEQVRAEIVQDVDTILTNLEQLSKQITESADGLILEEDAIAKIFASMKSGIAIAKCETQFKNYEKLLLAADANMQTAKTAKAMKELTDSVKAKKDKLSGSKLEVFNAKADKQQAKFEAQAEYEKERNKNALSEFEAELTEDEANISKDGVLGKIYFRRKQMLKNQVAEQGVETNAKIQMALKNDATAEKLATKLKALQDTQNELAKKIASGEKDGAEDLKELEGIKAYIKEITAIQKASSASAKIAEEAKKEAIGISESFYSTWASENVALLEGAVADLFSKAKGANDEAALAKAKSLAGKLKAAADAEYKAKVALVNKIKGKEVPKTIVILAGGDGDSAKEGENGYTLGEFIPKWGGGSEFVKPEEFGPMKDVTEVEANVDDAIIAAKAANKEGDDTDKTKSAEDVAKAELADIADYTKVSQEQLDKDKITVPPTEEGGEPTEKPKWIGVKTFVGKDKEGKDTEEKVMYAKEDGNESAATVDGENLEEGRKTVDSSAFGDDKLGYNDQFRGNTSLSQSLASDLGFNPKKPWSEGLGFDDQAMYSVGKPEGTIANDALSGKYNYAELLAMAKDYFGIKESEEIEEGNEFGAARAEAIAKGEKTFKVGDEEYPVEDVSKDDKENAEEFVEEAKVELPKKIKLYEGMSVADRFKALM